MSAKHDDENMYVCLLSSEVIAAFADAERLRTERNNAREECGVERNRAENYRAEMYIYLNRGMELQKEVAHLRAVIAEAVEVAESWSPDYIDGRYADHILEILAKATQTTDAVIKVGEVPRCVACDSTGHQVEGHDASVQARRLAKASQTTEGAGE